MKIFKQLALLSSMIILAVSCGSTSKKENKNLTQIMEDNISKKSIDSHIAEWPEDSKKAAGAMIGKYGLPSDYTRNSLVWHNVGPFAKTIVYKEPVKHLFPTPHNDVVEHFVYYASPEADKVAQVWEFSGSVSLDRTMGMMSARSDSEEANILALNLADQIIKGEKNVDEARMEYGQTLMQLSEASGQPSHLTKTLVFSTANDRVGDPDHTISDRIRRDRIQAEEEE